MNNAGTLRLLKGRLIIKTDLRTFWWWITPEDNLWLIFLTEYFVILKDETIVSYNSSFPVHV